MAQHRSHFAGLFYFTNGIICPFTYRSHSYVEIPPRRIFSLCFCPACTIGSTGFVDKPTGFFGNQCHFYNHFYCGVQHQSKIFKMTECILIFPLFGQAISEIPES